MARARTKGGTEDLIRRASDKVRRTYKGVISERASSALELPSVFVSTGSLVLDRLCAGVNPGGFPIGPRLGRVVHMAGEWSTGKAVWIEEQLLTPRGFVRAGDVRVGDVAVGSDGQKTAVTGVFPQGERDLYRVLLSDGESVVVDGDHNWSVKTFNDRHRQRPWRCLTTKDILMRGFRADWAIPTVKPVQFLLGDFLPIPPYILGVLLGDGELRWSAVSWTKSDPGVTRKVQSFLPPNLYVRSRGLGHRIKFRPRQRRRVHPYAKALTEMGLRCGSPMRFIPEQYLQASCPERTLLLQGLLDTDGTVDGKASVNFTSSSRQLAVDVAFLARSLGGIVSIRPPKDTGYRLANGERRSCRLAWTLTISGPFAPFLGSRKARRLRSRTRHRLRRIVGIEPAHRGAAVCFTVDAPDYMFVMSKFVVTHNSLILDHVFKSTQDVGGVCLVSETEGTRDTHFADAIGLDLDLLEVQRPATLEEAVDQGLTFHDEIRRSAGGASLPFVWGLDSLDSSETQRTADKGLSDSGAWHYGGGKSEALGAGLKKIVQRCARFPTTFILLNQTRDVVQTGPMQFGPKKRTSGGNAPHFYCSLELMLSPSSLGLVRAKSPMQPLGKDMIRKLGLYGADKGWVIGRWIRAKVAKTKIAPTLFDEGDFYVDFRRGVHRWGGLLQTMLREGRIELTPDGSGVRMRMAKDAVEFETQGAWLEWMTQHLDVLRVPKGTNAVPAEPETEGTEDAE